MNYVDSHCHLNSQELRETIQQELQLCQEAGVKRLMVVGCDLADSQEALEMRQRSGAVELYAAVGIHPHEARKAANGLPQALKDLAASEAVSAVGEIGLDYHYDFSPRPVQRQVLEEQLQLARSLDKPVIFHLREAYDDFWTILQGLEPKKAVLHCFSGTLADAKKALDRGWYLGITGVITFAKAQDFRDLVAQIPLESLICETDSPWLAPKPYRGKINRPSWVPLVYRALAEVKGLPLQQVTSQLWLNCADLFRWEA